MEDERRNSIRALTRVYYDYQQERMNLDGRLGLKKDGDVKQGAPPRDPSLLVDLYARREEVFGMETTVFKALAKEVHQHPLWNSFLADVKGCGESIAAVIISEFDIEKAGMVSNLCSFAGLAPGKDRRVKGEKCCYNQFLRSKLCGVLGSSFLKSGSPYTEHYYNMKNRLENSDNIVKERIKGGGEKEVAWKDATPKHRHDASIRYMMKMFLRDLYVAWRTIEGLPVREPYSEEYLGKRHGGDGGDGSEVPVLA